MKIQSLAILSLFLIFSCSNEEVSVSTADSSLESDSIEFDVSDCDFLSTISELEKLSYNFIDILDHSTLEQVSNEHFEILFDDSQHPNPRTSYFVGKFEIGDRTGLITYSENENGIGEIFHFYQIHILENCNNIYTEYIGLNDSNVMIYEIEGTLTSDFKTLNLTKIHSSYELVGVDNVTVDTIFTETYSVNLSSKEPVEELVNSEYELIKY